jgi:ferric-dicitrate binding protein FerR (iron transport regulator)
MRWLYTLKEVFTLRSPRSENEERLNRLLAQDVERLRSIDPETHSQWLRLQRSIAEQEHAVPGATRRLLPRLAFGAAMIAAVIAGVYLYVSPPEPKAETFVTERGQQARVALPGDAEALLNAATTLDVSPLQPGKPRRVTLSGEAFFRVRSTGTPFIVATDWVEVEVVGTEFNVRARGAEVEVAVLHGVVKVRGQDSVLTLRQHQIAVCPKGGLPRFAGTIPSAEYPGWMNGKLFLRQASFEAACRELELRFDISIRVDDPRVRNTIINGVLDARDPNGALASLGGLIQRTFRAHGNTYVLD